jgi:flavin-binding protein dodecin
MRRAFSCDPLPAGRDVATSARVAGSNVEYRRVDMADGVYRVTEVIGVSEQSWEVAARTAVETAAKTVRDLRIAEVVRQDVAIENGKIKNYRVRLAISFKYESSD